MELNCLGIHEVKQQLGSQGYQMADSFITSDALTGIEVSIGVDYFSCFISRQRRTRVVNLFVPRDRGLIPFRPLPKWVPEQQSTSNQYRCVRILCKDNPYISQLWKLDQIGITKGEFSPSERETISQVRSNLQKSESGYIVCLPFKSDARQSINYRTACRQLNSLLGSKK